MREDLIAPCGMDCALCSGYLALKYRVKEKGLKVPYCMGCRPRGKQCAFLKKRCALLADEKVVFCYECSEFPCENLKRIDKRYQTLYRMSLVDNLNFINKNGLAQFIAHQRTKWQCPDCSEVVCCHNGLCFNCNLEELKHKKKMYRWDEKKQTQKNP